MVTVEYGIFDLAFHLTTWLFKFITGINFKWDYVICPIIALLAWIGI